MMYYSRPVYIGVPDNIGTLTIPVTGLQTPLVTTLPPNDEEVEENVVRQIIDLLASRTNTVVIFDGGKLLKRVEERDLVDK
jgi:pyruvate decarboxylase